MRNANLISRHLHLIMAPNTVKHLNIPNKTGNRPAKTGVEAAVQLETTEITSGGMSGDMSAIESSIIPDSGTSHPHTPIADKYAGIRQGIDWKLPRKAQELSSDTEAIFEFEGTAPIDIREELNRPSNMLDMDDSGLETDSGRLKQGVTEPSLLDLDTQEIQTEQVTEALIADDIGKVAAAAGGTVKSEHVTEAQNKPRRRSRLQPSVMLERMANILDIPLNTMRRGGARSAGLEPSSAHTDPILMPVTFTYQENEEGDANEKTESFEKPEKGKREGSDKFTGQLKTSTAIIVVLSVLLLISITALSYLLMKSRLNKEVAGNSYLDNPYYANLEPPIRQSDPEVAALMNNPQLKKVFYGINYTPQGAQ